MPGQCRHGRWPSEENPRRKKKLEAEMDAMKKWKQEAEAELYEGVEIKNLTSKALSVPTTHMLKKLLLETINATMGVFNEAARRKIDYVHWLDNPMLMSLFKEFFKDLIQVKGVKIELRPFHLASAEPKLPLTSSYLRMQVRGNVKAWDIHPPEDLREMSFSQINAALDEDDWAITIYGVEHDMAPSPSTPASRPRTRPDEPGIVQPAQNLDEMDEKSIADLKRAPLTPPVILDRPGDPAERDPTQIAPYEDEELQTKSVEEIKPLKPNYNLRRVLVRIPKLMEDENHTKVKQLLLGLHERLWHSPISDFTNLLQKAGMSPEVIKLATEAVQCCAICRKYVRLPNRPQVRARGASSFNESVQMDLFMWENTWFMLLCDEATRFKMCTTIEGQESDDLLTAFKKAWIFLFGPPRRLVLDQQVSLMSHETAAEFERLSIERAPRGTTQGHGAEQHTGTGLVERHVGLMKLTMYKLRAELQRQGLAPENEEIAQESCMAHNITLSYGGVTPSMAVFGTLPNGFYDPESRGIMSVVGAQETDVTVFEKAMRIRQTALAQAHQAVIEDRVARAARTRTHQLDLDQLIAGTSEVEFYREVKNDPGWRGPALLLRLDADDGVAIIQYQGKPYLVALRHIRSYKGIFHFTLPNMETEDALRKLMRFVESLTEYKTNIYGWLKRNGKWRFFPREDDHARKIMLWVQHIYKGLSKHQVHGVLLGRSLRNIKPPSNTVGHLISWIHGGQGYAVQEHFSDGFLKMKRISNYSREEMCTIYLFHYHPDPVEEPASQSTINKDDDKMDVNVPDDRGEKRDAPETRTVVMAPEKKRQRIYNVKKELDFLRHLRVNMTENHIIQIDCGHDWLTGCHMWSEVCNQFMVEQHLREKEKLPQLFHFHYKRTHQAYACLRTAEIYQVDQETRNIEEADITADIWPAVEEADRNEIKQFVDEKAFAKIHKMKITGEYVQIDARWVRKRKRYPDKSIRIKSRLCARGCLDGQKGELTTRSTTATRLSQRILVSRASWSRKMSLESLDIAGAFLKGFDFEKIRKTLQKKGIQAPVRMVVIFPPLNVWRHLAEFSDEFKVPERELHNYGLLCLKPVYGLNDAPLAWQFSLHDFIRESGAEPSHLDENCWTWKKDGENIAMVTTHVDDLAITGTPEWLDDAYDSFVKKFGKVTRQQLPFTHCGCEYLRTADGYMISQQEFSEKITPAEVSDLRSILGALLWVTATRLDVIADVSALQSRVTVAEVKDLKRANNVLTKVKEFADVGLRYRYFRTKHRRLVCFHDASAASKGRNYAQEGVVIALADDEWRNITIDFEHTCETEEHELMHGGVMHVLHSHGAKAKRVSYSTSHGETLAMVNALESATLCMIRLSEMLHPQHPPSLKDLIKIQTAGNPEMPLDMYGDARDVYELITGSKTMPQDKTQRLYVLSIKEARLDGRVRMVTLVPTNYMLADSLTKSMVHEMMLMLLTTGLIRLHGVEKHPIVTRVLPTIDFDEHDLMLKDEEMILKAEKDESMVRTTHASVLVGLAAFATSKKMLAAMMPTLAFGTLVDAQSTEPENQEQKSYFSVYLMIFITVILAVMLERMVTSWMSKKRRIQHVKIESDDDDDMDVDQEGDQPSSSGASFQRKRKASPRDTWEDLARKVIDEKETRKRKNKKSEEDAHLQQQEIDSLKFDNEWWKDKYEKLEEKYDDKDFELKNLKNDMTVVNARKMVLESTVSDMRAGLVKLEDENAELKMKLDRKTAASSERPAPLTPRITDNAEMAGEIEKLQKMVKFKDQEIMRHLARIKSLELPEAIFITKTGKKFHREGCPHLREGEHVRPREAFGKCSSCCG